MGHVQKGGRVLSAAALVFGAGTAGAGGVAGCCGGRFTKRTAVEECLELYLFPAPQSFDLSEGEF
jgi:hypothetical protein